MPILDILVESFVASYLEPHALVSLGNGSGA